MTATNGKAKSDERKPCAAEKRQPIPKRISGDGSAPPRFRPVLFRLSVGVCAWLRRPRAQRAADGAASAAPSALPPTCILAKRTPNCHLRKIICFGGNMKYIDWLIQWLENYIHPSVKVRTYERYRLIVEQQNRQHRAERFVSACPAIVYNGTFTEW